MATDFTFAAGDAGYSPPDGDAVDFTFSAVNTLSVATAWRVQTTTETDTAWALYLATLSQSSAWRVLTAAEVDTAWQLISATVSTATVSTATAWRLTAAAEIDTAWVIISGLNLATSWQLRAQAAVDTSYKISTRTTADLVWSVALGLELDTSWRVRPPLVADTSYQIKNRTTRDTTWQLFRRPAGKVAWKVIETENDIPGINSHTVSVTIAGAQIEPTSISLSADIDSLSWTASLTLPDETAYNLCTDGAAVEITIDGMSWALKIKHRDRSRTYPAEQWQATAVSAFARAAEEPVSLTLAAETLVTEVAAAVAGMRVDWRLPNWKLPEGLKIAEASPRREILRDLADACGAIISSRPDGTLAVLPGTPTSEAKAAAPAQWAVAEMLNISRDVLPKTSYKRVLCGSNSLYLPRSISVQTMETDNKSRTAKIGVWIAPEPVEPTISNAGPATISVKQNNYVTNTITETVTFINGVGSLSNPVDEFTSIDWGGHTDLGAVSVTGENQLMSTVAGDSIGEVVYTTKYYEYILSAAGTEAVSTVFCASVDPLRSDIIADCQRGSGDLSPEVLTSQFCTALAAATERGRVYLDLNAGDLATIEVDKIWDGGKLPDLGDIIEYDNAITRLTALLISYAFPSVKLSATLEEVG